MGEFPSASMYSSARSLAKLGAYMANRGGLGGQSIMSEEAWNALHGEVKVAPFTEYGLENYFAYTQGGINKFGYEEIKKIFEKQNKVFDLQNLPHLKVNDGREGFYGWWGYGGSVF